VYYEEKTIDGALFPSEAWRPTPPDRPGFWCMLAGECEGDPELVRVDSRRGELWAVDCAVGSLPVKMYHEGLSDCLRMYLDVARQTNEMAAD